MNDLVELDRASDVVRAEPGDVSRLISALKRRHGQRITGELLIPERAACYAPFPAGLDARIAEGLMQRGITQLYSHQREAWDRITRGEHAVIVTPTASGKTLCYNLPVIQAAMQERSKALYLFPTKALAQDQVTELLELNQAGNLGVRAYTFDGDTPGDARKAVRTHGDIVISNPDMLHQGILPHHTKWAQFFENLKFVVIDEMHTYRGIFGSHVANVIRRLNRICGFYGVKPVYIFCSATIANPGQLASGLLGAPVAVIDQSGAPSGEKHLLFWNPPMINPDLGLRSSARSQTTRITRSAIKAGLKTIVFANTRLMVEVLTKYLKDVFDNDPRQAPRIAAYRGGYLPTERRGTATRLRGGQLDCVVATNALELGVDIGGLDVCLLNGFPGTIAGTWQRLGRAGRRNRPALGVLIATSDPLDQYIIRNPEFFTSASPEHGCIDPDQLLILMDHIRCAAFELPFQDNERFGKEPLAEMLSYLEAQGVLHHEGQRWHWMADSYPANGISLRSVADGNFVVVDVTDGKQDVIAEVDYSTAALTLYEGAIYLIQANPWQVEKLDWEGRKAFVTKTRADYYTDAIDFTRLKILDCFEEDKQSNGLCGRGEVHLVRRVAGYKKIRYYSHENVGYGKVNLPDHEMHTTAVWWQVSPDALEAAFPARWQALDGFLGAAYALHHVAALWTLSERHDLGRAVGDGEGIWFASVGQNGQGNPQTISGETVEIDDQQFVPTVFLYDNYAGGIGLSAPLFDLRHEIVARTIALVQDCGCQSGCPSCVGPILASDESRGYAPKQAVLTVLDLLSPNGQTHTLDMEAL
ncbi:DEAD/DEAH box helicase domain-containing protein [Nitrosospira sp. Nsp5]|uniref:DEAD/DEAH box helicase domain-containing protein n=1 Tax=Nitrosospira multiformis TaxID=1231 RepID=A0ABY0TFW4_9PROT|nr:MULTISPECIES: DEAD/DEAH box helicase [Nitrosospira]PTR10729.1 DEAD/DEAH box helicase domain-containing protein [Nitrosospira sp. Nsp5]SDQ76545.1 DEAD/DEAH box helicase domain-containing protein [Nitrosospira multiformis]